MRISDWSSDVCSSDLRRVQPAQHAADLRQFVHQLGLVLEAARRVHDQNVDAGGGRLLDGVDHDASRVAALLADRKSVVWGKSVSVRLDLGGRVIIKKKKITN